MRSSPTRRIWIVLTVSCAMFFFRPCALFKISCIGFFLSVYNRNTAKCTSSKSHNFFLVSLCMQSEKKRDDFFQEWQSYVCLQQRGRRPALSDHLPYATFFMRSPGRSHKTGLTVFVALYISY